MSPKKIQLLNDKKHRKETGLFLVEGEKNIVELLDSPLTIETLLGTRGFLNAYRDAIAAYQGTHAPFRITEADEAMLVKIGSLQSNNAGIAVVRQLPEPDMALVTEAAKTSLILTLDDVRDPGNLGTIIRTADWFGIQYIVASKITTDVYNPKVVASSMGSYARIGIVYADLDPFLHTLKEHELPRIIADMEGTSTHSDAIPAYGTLIMGSESHGISDLSRDHASHRVSIPRFGNAESLNVSVATGILLDTIRRNTH